MHSAQRVIQFNSFMYADTNNVFGCESKYFEYLNRELKCEK